MILESSNCNLTNHFGVIVQMWLMLSLGCYKWYQSNLIILCGAETFHGVGSEILSVGDCDTFESWYRIGKMNCPHWVGGL